MTLTRKLGFVADYCSVCRCVTPMQILRTARVEHLYFIPTGEGETLGHKLRCECCGCEVGVIPLKYTDIVKKKKTQLQDLISQTNPTLNGSSIVHENNDQRWAALAEPWLRTNASIRDRLLRGTQFDAKAGFALLCFGLSFFVTWWLCDHVMFFGANRIQTVLLGGIATFVWMWWEADKEPNRYFRKKLLAPLAAEFLRLNARHGEIVELFARSKKLRYKITDLTRVDDIVSGIESIRLQPVASRVLVPE